MLCTECKKNQANVHIVTEVNGKRKEEHLCSECAEKQGRLKEFKPENMFAGFFGMSPMRRMLSLMSGNAEEESAKSFFDEVFNPFGMLPEAEKKEQSEAERLRAEIGEAVREERYEDAARLRDEIKKLTAEREKLDALKAKLQEAIAEERYEDAAKLRDEIKALDKKPETAEAK